MKLLVVCLLCFVCFLFVPIRDHRTEFSLFVQGSVLDNRDLSAFSCASDVLSDYTLLK